MVFFRRCDNVKPFPAVLHTMYDVSVLQKRKSYPLDRFRHPEDTFVLLTAPHPFTKRRLGDICLIVVRTS